MTKNEVLKRMLSSESEVEMESIDGAQMTDTQWSKIYQAQEVLSKAPIFVDSSSELTLMRIKTKLRQLAAQVGSIGLVVVDYLQLLEQEDENASADLRSIQIGILSRGLKLLAKELNAAGYFFYRSLTVRSKTVRTILRFCPTSESRVPLNRTPTWCSCSIPRRNSARNKATPEPFIWI